MIVCTTTLLFDVRLIKCKVLSNRDVENRTEFDNMEERRYLA